MTRPGALLWLFLGVTGVAVVPPSLAATPAPTPGPPAVVTLTDVLAWLHDHSPRTLADRAAVDVAAAEVVQAGILPNPSVSYDQADTVSGIDTIGERQRILGLEMPLLIWGERGARVDAARRQTDAASADVRSRYADAAQEARRLFVALL